MEKAFTAAIDAVAKVVDGVLKFAQAFVDAIGAFLAIIGDIASGPIAWLRNLGAGFMDGVHNYVWPALVAAVKGWFKEKVEEVVGVGAAIMTVLRHGGITFMKIVSMAWTAIKESLPGILIQILIEKLIAMLIPAAGALSVIIDGIKAAWGAAQKILAAFQKFLAFLKKVKPGEVGSGVRRRGGGRCCRGHRLRVELRAGQAEGCGQKVGGTLRKLAEKFMKGLKKVAGVVKRGAKAAVGAIKRGAQGRGPGCEEGCGQGRRRRTQGAPDERREDGRQGRAQSGRGREADGPQGDREGQGGTGQGQAAAARQEEAEEAEEAEGDARPEAQQGRRRHQADGRGLVRARDRPGRPGAGPVGASRQVLAAFAARTGIRRRPRRRRAGEPEQVGGEGVASERRTAAQASFTRWERSFSQTPPCSGRHRR